MTPLLEFLDVSFNYEHRPVVGHLNFTIEQGECAALIGPNGVGKTTLLRLAGGTLKRSHGTISLAGRRLDTLPRSEVAKLVALVPQRFEVPFDFTVEQIVEQGRTPYLGLFAGFKRRDREAVERALDLADVASLRNRIFNELSGGERQRVKIALGLAQEPRLLLLDEPTQSLDLGRQLELLGLIQTLNDQGVTILAAMHDLQLIEGTFSSVLLLEPNHELRKGPPQDILRADILERAFDCPPQRHPKLGGESRALLEKML
ncbi:MAG: ABC transporter ATP-binding protein [Candidatus Sulfotelmatobacter sp.]